MRKRASENRRTQGGIERRGNSLRVKVYAGTDPLTGKRLYLTESTTDEAEAERILTRLRNQVDEQRHAKTRGTLRVAMDQWLRTAELDQSTLDSYETYKRLYIYPALGDEPISKITARVLEELYAELRRCRKRCDSKPFIEHRVDGPHECREVKHKRPPGRPPVGGYPPHDCQAAGCKVIECRQHTCVPLANATILKIHYMFSGTFTAAMRWEWVKSNPAEVAKKPRQPVPEPDPPSPEEAARIVEAAWAQDLDWGTLVWLVMVTGMRRSELVPLKWRDVDLNRGKLSIYSSKTHRRRKVSLDAATVEVLTDQRERYESTLRALGLTPTNDAYLFSASSTYDKPFSPSWVTHRYSKMCADLGIDSHLHALRHYAATELITAGVDLRTVAGRLGHASGGVTTLRVYAAWVDESDKRAAEILGGRMDRPAKQNDTEP